MIINATNHPITVIGYKEFPPGKNPWRIRSIAMEQESIDGIPIVHTKWMAENGFPEEQRGVYYIVSQTVKFVLHERCDLLVPADLVKYKGTRGCRKLSL